MSYKKLMNTFFNENPQILKIKKHIPEKYLAITRKRRSSNFYLICPESAKKISQIVKPYLNFSSNQFIAETNAGLGLITKELLKSGAPFVRMCESCSDFRLELQSFATIYPDRVDLCDKDIFCLPQYAYIDQHDDANRVDDLLKGVPKKNWTDEPVLSIIGSMSHLGFLRYLVTSLCLQKSPVTYGRIQIFAMLKSKDFQLLFATPKDNLKLYQKWTVILNLLFDFELLEKFPRSIFLPWESKMKKDISENVYLIRINFKKDLPVEPDKILHLYFFVRQLYGKGNNAIVPTVEKWIQDAGPSIIAPNLKHEDYFEHINIFTKFRELTPNQILSVFKEAVNYPTYFTSAFIATLESDLIKTETIETMLADSKLQKKIRADIEEKHDK